MPMTATSRASGSGASLRHSAKLTSRILPLASASQSLAWSVMAAAPMAMKAARAYDLGDESGRSSAMVERSVPAHLEKEIRPWLVTCAERGTVLRLLGEIELHGLGKPLVNVDAVRPLGHASQRADEVPGKHGVTLL